MRLLDVASLETFYGKAQVLFDVELAVDEGAFVALMGRNGMGKTTTIRSICALTPPRSGRLRLGRTDLAGLKPHQVARLGVGLVPEGRRCFPNLTVEEKMRLRRQQEQQKK